jgi:DNA processing protein
MTDDKERLAYLALAGQPALSATRLRHLVERFGSWNGVLAAPFAFLCNTPGMTRAAATAVHEVDLPATERLLTDCLTAGITVLVPTDRGFPEGLRQIADPPTRLFVRGRLDLLSRPAVAIVGSRDHSSYGEMVTQWVAQRVAEAGVVVVSGMARGLDAVAHAAALEPEHGGTIGVLGNGLGVVYPAANRALYEQMEQRGLLLTEYPPGERPQAWSFPRRNRLISGLVRAVVVVEAAVGSGALVTAGCAADQGREVLAVPGPITSPTSAGTNQLIRDGATPLLTPDDVLALFGEIPPRTAGMEPPPRVRDWPGLSSEERRVAEALVSGPKHVDQLVDLLAVTPAALSSLLLGLELRGVVTQESGMRYAVREVVAVPR